MENNCNWHFDKHSGRVKGVNNPLEENFKAHPYYSIVREAIQNSLDAIDDINHPVRVSFKFDKLNRRDFPNLIENLSKHIKWCEEYWRGNDDAKKKINEMLKYLNGSEPRLKKAEIPFLKISDYNTKGMYYNQGDPMSTFNAFLRSEGNSSKNNAGSGGSFGFGKAAYFNLSPFKTIIVSTRNKDEQVIFEGATVLTTHKNENDEKLSAYGFYNCKGDEPVLNENDIPEKFIRNEIGTDINIIGLWNEGNRKDNMIKSVLNNFWLAIHNKKLIVEVDGEIIDKTTLAEFINQYYEREYETGKATEINNWNPKPYYYAVRNYGINNNKYISFEDELESVGKVKLYIYLNKGLPNRISYFRKPQMLVYKQTKNKLKGYVAVFICEDEKGNEILKKMENPAHNEWKIENYQEEGKPHPDARKIKTEISNFINEKLDELSSVNTSQKLTIEGLEEYLNIPGDLLNDNEMDFDYKGENENTKNGDLSDENSDKETGMQTTTSDIIKIKPTISYPNPVKNEFEGNFDDEEEKDIVSLEGGNENETDGGNRLGEIGEEPNTRKVNNDGETIIRTPLNIKFRVIASVDKHFLILKSLFPIENAEIEILAGTDNGVNEPVNIKSSSQGTVYANKIKELSLNPGKNVLDVEFEDSISHSLKLKAYELQ